MEIKKACENMNSNYWQNLIMFNQLKRKKKYQTIHITDNCIKHDYGVPNINVIQMRNNMHSSWHQVSKFRLFQIATHTTKCIQNSH